MKEKKQTTSPRPSPPAEREQDARALEVDSAARSATIHSLIGLLLFRQAVCTRNAESENIRTYEEARDSAQRELIWRINNITKERP